VQKDDPIEKMHALAGRRFVVRFFSHTVETCNRYPLIDRHEISRFVRVAIDARLRGDDRENTYAAR
jgi:hypothetical protein